MNLEETIQSCFDNYPTLYQTREQVLNQLFCVIGNGYEWINGELVNDNDKKPINNLYNGKAKQYNIITKGKYRKMLFDEIKSDKENYKILTDILKEKGKTLEDKFLTPKSDDNELQFKIDKSIYPLCIEYSKMFNYPNDIKEDWLNGIRETYEYIIFHIDENSDTFDEVSKLDIIKIYNNTF